jgi:hypothetical protein
MAARSRSKEAVFLVLAVATLVTAVVTFRGHRKPAATATVAPPPRPQQVAQVRSGLGLADPVKTMPMANGSRNPFAAPPGTPKEALEMEPTTEAEARPRPQPQVPVQTVVVGPTVVPQQALPTLVAAAPAPQQTGPLPPAGVAAPPPSTKPSLSGIVADGSGNPTAIIYEGDQRYFAQAGDTVGGKYRVQSISNQQVVLVADRERLILKMGGS